MLSGHAFRHPLLSSIPSVTQGPRSRTTRGSGPSCSRSGTSPSPCSLRTCWRDCSRSGCPPPGLSCAPSGGFSCWPRPGSHARVGREAGRNAATGTSRTLEIEACAHVFKGRSTDVHSTNLMSGYPQMPQMNFNLSEKDMKANMDRFKEMMARRNEAPGRDRFPEDPFTPQTGNSRASLSAYVPPYRPEGQARAPMSASAPKQDGLEQENLRLKDEVRQMKETLRNQTTASEEVTRKLANLIKVTAPMAEFVKTFTDDTTKKDENYQALLAMVREVAKQFPSD